MSAENKCPKCGSSAFKEGMLGSGHANVKEVGKNLQIGLQVIVTFCSKCGEIISMRVTNPEKFK